MAMTEFLTDPTPVVVGPSLSEGFFILCNKKLWKWVRETKPGHWQDIKLAFTRGWRYIVRVLNSCQFCLLFYFQQKNRHKHQLRTMVWTYFHKLFPIHNPTVAILIYQTTKQKHQPPLIRHQVLENMVSDDWWDSSINNYTFRQLENLKTFKTLQNYRIWNIGSKWWTLRSWWF